MGIFDIALKEKKEEKLGSQFGGGWGIPDLIKKTKADEPITPEALKEPAPITDFDIALKAPSTAEMSQKQDILLKLEEDYELLNVSIGEDYKQYQELTKQLDDLEVEIQEAPEEMQWNLIQKFNQVRDIHNGLVDKLQTNTAQQKKIYQEKNLLRESYDKDVDIHNKWAEAKNREPEPKGLGPVDIGEQFTTASIVQRLEGKTYRTGEKEDPTWGNVIKHSLRSGLGQFQASLVNLFRLIDMRVTKLTDPIQNIIPIDDEKVKAFKEKYGEDPTINTIDMLTKIVEESEKIATESAEQAESKQWLKKLVGTGLKATPQVLGAVVLGTGMPVVGGVAAAKPTAEIITRVTQMIPFGLSAAGGQARQIEKEYEALGKEAPYYAMVIGGALSGIGEMATELPVFMGVARMLKGGGKALINKGAKTLIDKYGNLGIEFIKNVVKEAWQEAEMVPIEKGVKQAVGLPQDWSIEPLVKEMGENAYGGMAMALVLGGLGGSVAGSVSITNKTMEVVDNVIQNKGNIREGLRKIAELQGIIPAEPEAVALAYKEEKEPWQITKKEYIGDTIWIESAKNEHIQSVVNALKEGKPVPAGVLKDYPDLKAEVKEPAIPKELEPLAKEARKYKSAEEFVKSQVGIDITYPTIQGKKVELIKNPTHVEIKDMKKEYRESAKIDFKGSPTFGEGIRDVSDDLGNIYIWREDQATHGDIEKYLLRENPDIVFHSLESMSIRTKKEYANNKQNEIKRLTDIYTQAIAKPKPKGIKAKVREITGQVPGKIEIAERDILRLVLRGEAKGARRAFAEAKKEGIFEQKEHFAEVVGRAKERKAKRDEIGKVKDILKKTDLKKLRPERQKAIKDIIDEIDLAKMTERTEKKLTSRLDYIKENPDNLIPQEKIDELARLNKKPISDLTAEDIALIKDSILHEINLNKLKNKIIFGKEIKEAAEELKKARENILKGKDLKKDDLSIIDSGITEHRTSWQKIKSIWGIQSFNPEVICEELDFKDHGEIMKYVFNGIDNGVTDKFRIMQEADDWFVEELEGIDVSKWSKPFQANRKNIDFQNIELSANIELKIPKRKIKITKGERISFLLHEKNNKNLAHLTEGGFRFSDNLSRRYKMTEENIEEIINSATAEEVKVADTLWKFFNEFIKPKLNETSMELNGWEVATEDNYYPIKTVELDRRRDALRARKNFNEVTLEGLGIFKERINASNALLIEDAFTVAYKHLEATSSYIGLAKPLRYAKLVLEDTAFQENVMRAYGKDYIDNLKKYLQEMEADSVNLDNVDKLTAELINKLDSAILGAHIFVAFKQPVSYLVASTEIDTRYLAKATIKKNDYEEIRKYSPQLRQRLDGHITRELGELGNVGKVRQLFLHKSPLNSKILFLIRKFDAFTIGKIWSAAKIEVKEQNPDISQKEFFKKVTERTEEIVRRTQPTWHTKDRSEMARNKSIFIRLLTKYTSQRNKNRIVLKRSTLRYNRGKHRAWDRIVLIKNYSIVLLGNALLINAIDELRRKAYGRKSRTIWQQVVGAIGTALSNFYFVGDIFSSLASKIQKGTYAGYDTGNIVSSYVDNAIDGITELTNTIEQLHTKERYKTGTRKGALKWKTSALRALDRNASTLLAFKGLPYNNVRNLIAGTWKMAGGKEEETKETKKEKRFTPEKTLGEKQKRFSK